jgi:SAM-dependent methyltransferase
MSTTPPICDYEGSDYQATFWDTGERAYEDRVEAIALNRLLPKSGNLLLELGAGAGRNTPRYSGYARIVLLDYSRTQLELARDTLGESERYIYVAADVYHLPFVPGLFDGTTMIRVLHHIVDPELALHQIHQVLSPGGIFILEYANKQNLKAILRYITGRQSWNPFNPQPIEFAPLNFDFHPRAMKNWLAAVGFRIERQLTVSHFRIGTLKRLIPLNALVRLDSLIQRTGNWWQLSPSVFIRAQATGESPIGDSQIFFRCPACETYPLLKTEVGLNCPTCTRFWSYQGGIYDFRIQNQ